MEKYDWLNTKNGSELSVFAEELKEKFYDLPIGESSAMLGGAMAASMRRKAIELDISPEEAVDYYFYTVMKKNMITKK
ncbi:MAG: hypothetical protein NTY91_07440 [Euryarchaeota archaeon]|jgi:hypothetical protein|nr:hypothetical protein [Euryarchaeota archaeon]